MLEINKANKIKIILVCKAELEHFELTLQLQLLVLQQYPFGRIDCARESKII
jgi:hypothetical protein